MSKKINTFNFVVLILLIIITIFYLKQPIFLGSVQSPDCSFIGSVSDDDYPGTKDLSEWISVDSDGDGLLEGHYADGFTTWISSTCGTTTLCKDNGYKGPCEITKTPVKNYKVVLRDSGSTIVYICDTQNNRMNKFNSAYTNPDVTPQLSCSDIAIELPNKCNETDNGFDFYIRGEVSWPGNQRTDNCVDSTILTEWACLASVGFAENYTCPYGCYLGACITEPTGVCTPGESKCLSSVTYANCLSSSVWSGAKYCPSGQTCSNGVCSLSSQCTSGSKECVSSTSYRICTNNQWSSAVSCPSGQTCSGGVCSSTQSKCGSDDTNNNGLIEISELNLKINMYLNNQGVTIYQLNELINKYIAGC